jgi:hypothetical protein
MVMIPTIFIHQLLQMPYLRATQYQYNYGVGKANKSQTPTALFSKLSMMDWVG